MRRDPYNIGGSSYRDETINPYQLFEISARKEKQNYNTVNYDQKMVNFSSSASNVHSKTENNITPKYRPLTQQSLTEQSMNDQNSTRKGDAPCSISFEPGRSGKGGGLRCQLGKKRRDRNPELKHIIHRHKIRNIVRNFTNKISRNNAFAPAIEMQSLDEHSQGPQWLNLSGIVINQSLQRGLDIFFLGINFLCIYFYTLGLAFNIYHQNWVEYFQGGALFAFLIEFLLGMMTTKCISGKLITKLKEIIESYLQESLVIDLSLIVLMTAEIFFDGTAIGYMKLVIVFKLPNLLEKLEKVQIHFISTTYKEQYWSLIKIFLFNFCFAHFLALVLRSMANLSPGQNWMTVKGMESSSWWQAYIWSYYWAINIMLTVGFGDISASNHLEALCLIFIETFSCMVLAYNINCVGSLISNIRSQDLEKSKKYKIFRSLAGKNSISTELSLRIGNYIEESNNIKKKFNIEEENRFIDALPRIFKKDYLKEANKSIFQKIFFFTNLADKAVQALAESIEVSITHPEELIVNVETYMSLKILKEGRMGYCCRKLGSKYNGYVIDQISVAEGEAPFLLGVEFITHRRPTFEIKAMEYSIIYGLAYDRLIQSLRKSRGDYEYFCFLRDKSKYLVDEFQIKTCKHCKTKHTRFLCPRLHFIPIKQQVINFALHSEKVSRCDRVDTERIRFRRYNPLSHFHSLNEIPLGEQDFTCSTISKNKEFFVKELRNIDRINTELSHQRSLFDYPMVFLHNTAESIKQELATFLRRENEEDEVWTIALDSMQNYKNYFPDDNPAELENRFNPERNLTFVGLGKSHRYPFIQYHNKEKTIKEGTYIQRLEHAFG